MKARAQPVFAFFAALGVFALGGVTFLTWFGPDGWLVNLLQHFPFYTALGWGFVALLAAGAGWPLWRYGSCAALGLASLAWWATPWWPQVQPDPGEDAQELILVWANLWHNHDAVVEFVDWLDSLPEKPDIVSVGEVHEQRSIDLLKERYPQGVHDLHAGIGLFGGDELQDLGSVLMSQARPILHGTWRQDGVETEVIACHALLPFGSGQGETFSQLARMARDRPAALVFGDLNTTPWSRDFKRLKDDGDLRDARAGYGPKSTWVSKRLPILRLPIDHVLARGPLFVERFERGPDTKSDHRGLLVEIRVGR